MVDHGIKKEDMERLKEGISKGKMLAEIDQKIEIGDKRYLLPTRWLLKWQLYCFDDLMKLEEGSQEAGERPAPGKIDYSEILEELGSESTEQEEEV